MTEQNTSGSKEPTYLDKIFAAVEKASYDMVQRKKILRVLLKKNKHLFSGSYERMDYDLTVLDDYYLFKEYIQMTIEESKKLEGINLDLCKTYIVTSPKKADLLKFKAFFLLTDNTRLFAEDIDLQDIVKEEMGITTVSESDIERGKGNISIVYIRKNLGLMGRGNNLFINKLLNYVSARNNLHRKTLVLSEVIMPETEEMEHINLYQLLRDKKGNASEEVYMNPVEDDKTPCVIEKDEPSKPKGSAMANFTNERKGRR